MILFFAVFTNLSLIEFYFRALILKSTSRSLGPLHNYSNIFFFIGFIFTINYANIYTILVNPRCIDIVRRNSILDTHGSLRVKEYKKRIIR